MSSNLRPSTMGLRPSVVDSVSDEKGNVDMKKTIMNYSDSQLSNKHLKSMSKYLLVGCMVLIGANICISVAIAYLTRQFTIDPMTGLATANGVGDGAVMRTASALESDMGINLHTASTQYLSSLERIEFLDGAVSFKVKGHSRMSNDTIILVEGGSLTFDMDGLKNVTGSEPRLMVTAQPQANTSVSDDKVRMLNFGGLFIYAHILSLVGLGQHLSRS